MPRISFLFWLDVLLLIVIAVLQTPKSTGLVLHEWGGNAFAAIVTVHLVINWPWLVSVSRRVRSGRGWRQRVNLLLNTGLFVVVVLAVFSGVMISEVFGPLVGLTRSTLRVWSTLHRVASTVALAMVGLHIALNWDWVTGVVRSRRFLGPSPRNDEPVPALVPRALLSVGGFGGVLRRIAALGCATAAVCVLCFASVKVSYTDEHPARLQAPKTEAAPGWVAYNAFAIQPEDAGKARQEREGIFAREVSTALMSIGLAAMAGRVVLRLRL